MTDEKYSKEKPTILIVCNYYLPGYKAGGGLRTVVHMVERFREKFDFRVVTLDCDVDGIPYKNVKINEWNEVDGSQVFYLSQKSIKLSKLRELISEVEPALVYMNSVFSKLSIFVLLLRKLKLLPKTPVILAPEGELSGAALESKAYKKKPFVKFAKAAGLYKHLIWKVTAEPERIETERFKGISGEIFVAPNLPFKSMFEDYRQDLKPIKKVGEAKMIFLSRYMPHKNFKWLMDNLSEITGNLEIDIWGPIEDEVYWAETQRSIEILPSNIKVNYKGSVPYEQVCRKLFDYHFFVLPTLGENFGHVFVEALVAGCPVIMSDRTPWLGLKSKHIGWDLPLEEPREWNKIINYCIGLNQADYTDLSSSARMFAQQWLANPEVEEATLRVLENALQKRLINAS